MHIPKQIPRRLLQLLAAVFLLLTVTGCGPEEPSPVITEPTSITELTRPAEETLPPETTAPVETAVPTESVPETTAAPTAPETEPPKPTETEPPTEAPTEAPTQAPTEPAAPPETEAPPTDPQPEAETHSYVLNTNTHRFHLPSCGDVKRIKPENREDYTGTRENLISQGYKPCGHCHP